MSRTARLWKGAGPLTLGGLILSGAVAIAGEPPAPPLADQLVTLANQAKTQGRKADAARFFAEALKRDPNNLDARRGLDGSRTIRLARQDPTKPIDSPDQPAHPPAPATGANSAAGALERAAGDPGAPGVATPPANLPPAAPEPAPNAT